MRVSPSSIATPLLAPLRQLQLAIFPIPAVILALALSAAQASSQDNCGEGRDFVVQALEQIKTGTPSEVEGGLQLLKHANSVCVSSVHDWYYRSFLLTKL